jgi:hypothetical protein
VLATPAEWIDRLLGPALLPLAALAGVAAAALAAVAVGLALWRAFLAFGTWRYGWEEAPVVRCPVCGALAADPENPLCGNGHPVRFPPGARVRAAWRRTLRPWSGAIAALQTVACLLLAIAAAATWLVAGTSARRLAAAALAGGLASLVASGAVLAALAAIAPGGRGIASRVLHLAVALLLCLPAAALSVLSSALDSPEPRIVGSLWSTPTAVYVEGARGKGRRLGGAAPKAVARIVEVRLPGAGALWQGVSRIEAGGASARWRGERGLSARLLGVVAAPETSSTAFVRERAVDLELPVNRKVWVVRRGEKISFDPAAPGDLPPPSL